MKTEIIPSLTTNFEVHAQRTDQCVVFLVGTRDLTSIRLFQLGRFRQRTCAMLLLRGLREPYYLLKDSKRRRAQI